LALQWTATTLAILTAAVVVLCALVLWAAVAAFHAVARLTHSAKETARDLETLTRRLDELARASGKPAEGGKRDAPPGGGPSSPA